MIRKKDAQLQKITIWCLNTFIDRRNSANRDFKNNIE